MSHPSIQTLIVSFGPVKQFYRITSFFFFSMSMLWAGGHYRSVGREHYRINGAYLRFRGGNNAFNYHKRVLWPLFISYGNVFSCGRGPFASFIITTRINHFAMTITYVSQEYLPMYSYVMYVTKTNKEFSIADIHL